MDRIPEAQALPASQRRVAKWRADHPFAVELHNTAKLAFPMALTQLGQVAMVATDLCFIGRIGTDALAAAALASRVYLFSFAFGLGLLAAIAPVAAQAFGAGNLGVVRRSLRMGLWEAALLSGPIMAVALHGEAILLALGQRPDAARLAQHYLFGLAWGVGPALCFQVVRSVTGAVNRPEPVLWIMLGAAPVNALLVYLLLYGKLGLPRLELFGVGLATSIVNCGMFLAGLFCVKMRLPFRDYHVLAQLWRFDWLLLRQLIVIGIPISITTLMGYGVSSAAAVMASRISTSALAAHQIAVQIAAILFIMSYGISTAAAVRVSHAVGRNDSFGIKQAGLVAMLLGSVLVTILTLPIIVARFEIAQLVLGEPVDLAGPTTRLAAKLILIGASFYITDAVGTIATGALRGLKDTRVPLLFACIAYWLVGISLSYVLMNIGLGAVGIWIGLSIGSTIYGGLLALRFWLLTNRCARHGRHLST